MLTPAKNRSAGFINVDFDIWSRSDLSPLVSALSAKAHDLNNERSRGRHWVTFELNVHPRTADQAIRRFGALIEQLPRPTRRLWNEATVREFNVGLSRSEERQDVVLSEETVALAARLSARIVATLYPRGEDD